MNTAPTAQATRAIWQTLTNEGASQSPAANGLVELDDLVVLTFTGTDVRQFLHGYLTCNTLTMKAAEMHGAALCNLQGRVVATGWCEITGEHELAWLVHSSLEETLTGFLRPYLAFSRTTLTTAGDLVLGRLAEPGNGASIADTIEILRVRDSAQLRMLWSRFGPGSRDLFDRQLIRAGIPWLSAAVSGRFLPQMLNLARLGVVDFDKGCYLGQEVVARAQHRGQVKRNLVAFTCESDRALESGSVVEDQAGSTVGTVIQASHPVDGESLALVVVRDSAEPPLHQQDKRLRRLDKMPAAAG